MLRFGDRRGCGGVHLLWMGWLVQIPLTIQIWQLVVKRVAQIGRSNVEQFDTCRGYEEMIFPLSLFVPKNLVPRDGFGRTVPRQPTLSAHPGSSWFLLTGPPDFRDGIHLYRQPPSCQSRVYQVTHVCPLFQQYSNSGFGKREAHKN